MKGPQTLMEFMHMYRTAEDCRQALFAHRWPDGFSCPRCSCDRTYREDPCLVRMRALRLSSLAYGRHHPAGARVELRKWFLAIYLLAATKKTLSSAELARQLGIVP